MSDTINRQAAIDAVEFGITYAKAIDVNTGDSKELFKEGNDALRKAVERLKDLPSVEPERLTDDDFETIRIHLNAYKEKLCNQQRWEEAEEYQRIIDRFMVFASAQPDLQPTCNQLATDTISRKEATTIPVTPKEHREYQTMNLDDAYEQGWFDYQKCIEDLPSAEPKTPQNGSITCVKPEKMHDRTMGDCISRKDAIEAVDSETVSTNPEHFKSSEKFIKFMDDVDIASFGKWKWANGFNTALVATRVQLKKLPSAQPEIIRCKDCKHYALEVGDDSYALGYCPFIGSHLVMSKGFCAWGERRGEEDENR